MSTLVSTGRAGVDATSDAELISAVRAGETDAYGELFQRHVEAARRLARQLVTGPDVDDLVSEAFARVLVLLRRGSGPDLSFRAYLLTAVRRLHVDRLRAAARLQPTADLTPFDPGVPFRDTAVEGFENDAAARAFASLPERWQLVLWHTEVEGQRPAEVAPLLGLSPNGVSALAYRAREGLRQAFLSMHARDAADAECAWTHEHLGAYVRGGLARRDAVRVEQHVGGCHRCAAVWLELDDLNAGLAGLLAPLLLGAAATGYVGAGGGAGAGGLAGVVGGLAAGAAGLVGRLKGLVAGHLPATAATGLTVGAAVVSGALLWPGHQLARIPATSSTEPVVEPAAPAHPLGHAPRAADRQRSSQPAPRGGEVAAEQAGEQAGEAPGGGPRADAGPAATAPSPPLAAPRGSDPAAVHDPRDGGPGPVDHRPGRPDVDVAVRLEGLPPGGSTSVGVTARTGLPGRDPVRRRIVVGASGRTEP